MLRVRLFGEPHVAFRDATVVFRAHDACVETLAYLLLHRDAPVARESLATKLCPDIDDAAARTELRRRLHAIGAQLPPIGRPWIHADRRTLRWNPNVHVDLDVDTFVRGVEAGDPAAVAAYRGDLLPESTAPWVRGLRERYRERAIALLLRVADERLTEGDRRGAVEALERALEYDPLCEEAVRAAIVTRYAAGDRAGAVRTYHRFVETLRDELDVEPHPETVAAFRSVVAGAGQPRR